MASRKYELLNDYDWVYRNYVVSGRSATEIAKSLGVKTSNSVRQALLRFGIEIRGRSDSLRQEDYFILNEDIINGCLLGDGSLESWNKYSDVSYPRFCKKNKYYDHVAYVARALFSKNWEDRISEGYKTINGKHCTYFSLRSHTQKILMSFFRKWYPKENYFKKVVPLDLKLNETVLLHWFLDDGSTSLRKRKSKQVRMVFCCESFDRESQEFLCKKLKGFDIIAKVRPYSDGSGWRIYIPQSQVELFFKTVGDCPVDSLAYKWK